MINSLIDSDVPITHLITKKKDNYVCFSFWLKKGSRNENKEYYGLVHLAEHLITLLEIDNEPLKDYLNKMAVEYKIFTSVDFVCFQVKCENKYAIEIFNKICRAFNLVNLSPLNFKKERERVINELKVNYSNHRKNYFNAIRERVWSENMGHPILGNIVDVEHVSFDLAKKVLMAILSKENLFVLYTGNVPQRDLTAILNNELNGVKSLPVEMNNGSSSVMNTHNILVSNVNVINSSLVYPIESDLNFKEQLALMIVCRLLAFGNNGALKASLESIYYVMAMVFSFKYEKSLVINFVSPSENIKQLTAKIIRFLNEFVIKDYKEVEVAKRSLISDITKASETDFGSINYIGQAIIDYGGLFNFNETLDEIKKMSLSDLNDAMKKINFNGAPLQIQLNGDEISYG